MSPNPLWDFSLQLYARPGVATACLRLQDELGLDVNLLFFCLWCAVAGPGRVPEHLMRQCVATTSPWRQRAVLPLRQLRRRLKTDPGGVPVGLIGPFREQLKEIELAAERLEQDLLMQLVPPAAAGGAVRAELEDACENLACYLRVLDLRPAPVDRERLQLIIGAALPDVVPAQTGRALAAAV